jgi:hypothetical protein
MYDPRHDITLAPDQITATPSMSASEVLRLMAAGSLACSPAGPGGLPPHRISIPDVMKLKIGSRSLHGECGSDLQIRTGHFDHFRRAAQNSPRARAMGTSRECGLICNDIY